MEKNHRTHYFFFFNLTLVNFNEVPEKRDVLTQIHREGVLSTYTIQQTVCEEFTLGWTDFPYAESSVRW